MSNPSKPNLSPSARVKLALVSILSALVTSACAWLRLRPTPEVMCYVQVAPTATDPPTPIVMCYEVVVSPEPATLTPTGTLTPTNTPTLTPICYTPTLPPPTKADPMIMCYAPPPPLETPATPTPEARSHLRERLLAEGRFPAEIAGQLDS